MSKSSAEEAFIPHGVDQKGLKRVFRYHGPSMQPTFKAGQVLYVRPNVQDVKAGDVVVYETDGQYVVHRIISTGKNGYITRGDNNLFVDITLVTPEQLVGRVEIGEHRGEITSVRGGQGGLWLARLVSMVKGVEPTLRLVFGWPYRLLKASKLMPRIWKPAISQIHLKTDTGTLVKYIYNKKTVAVWDAKRGRFECRKPFDLVIIHSEGQ